MVSALIPWLLRLFLPGDLFERSSLNGLAGNVAAIVIAFWMRLSISVYPGIQRSAVILPSALTGHGLVLLWLAMTRFPYDRIELTAGFLLHVFWLYLLYVYAERGSVQRIAIVPFGSVSKVTAIPGVDWRMLKYPRLSDLKDERAIVADFGADLPDAWEAFLADAALSGKMVYQVKQLAESLTGKVEIEHLSENSFGALVPARGYFYLKALIDWLAAFVALPVALPLMGGIALAIRIDSEGPVLFRQSRVGHAGKAITVYKFRTMHTIANGGAIEDAITDADDDRVTRVGRWLRNNRLDELPQLFNILKREMSWIGPRPEADILSRWYTNEIPFYRYRHVVKPGISGWAQVNQGHVAAVGEVHLKLQYDFYYIKYFSPWLDILILFRTIKTMLSGFGAR